MWSIWVSIQIFLQRSRQGRPVHMYLARHPHCRHNSWLINHRLTWYWMALTGNVIIFNLNSLNIPTCSNTSYYFPLYSRVWRKINPYSNWFHHKEEMGPYPDKNGAVSAISTNNGWGWMPNSSNRKFGGSKRCKFGQNKDGTCKRAGDRSALKGGKEFLNQRWTSLGHCYITFLIWTKSLLILDKSCIGKIKIRT